nr:uncharacterized protein LOC111427675 [Onthophagus taurus]XP_022918667.1 uncharacterized protein LOC111427675 [Onthophagus taurus]
MDDELDLLGLNDLDLIRTLEQRSLGNCRKVKGSPYDLQIHAEDVFIHKQFDELRCDIPDIPRSTFLMVFSPDGTKIASTHGNHNIYVTDSRTGKNIRTLSGHPRTPWCIAFHPTSNQILASGCLGGQVRIWDLSGGSEIWTSDITSVIASIAFHPDDRLLVIATCNELHFWDWTKPEPFMSVSTGNSKEKVRYVAFSKEGTKLITGISNCPQMRWERVRAPVPISRQTEGAANSYRRRITPRLVTVPGPQIPSPPTTTTTTTTTVNSSNNNTPREPLSTVPERERRITACYRNLVREYELLVQRYLQVYRPPTMIDQGTDPMEEEIDLSVLTGASQSSSASNTPIPNNSTSPTPPNTNESENDPQASTSSGLRSMTSTPRRYGSSKPISTIGTQTTSTFSYNSSSTESIPSTSTAPSLPFRRLSEMLMDRLHSQNADATTTNETESNSTQTENPRRILVINEVPANSATKDVESPTLNLWSNKVVIKCNSEKRNVEEEEPKPSTSGFQSKLKTLKARPKYDHSRKRTYSGLKKNRRPVWDTSTDSSSTSDDDESFSKRKCSENVPTTSTSTIITSPENDSSSRQQPLNFNRKLEILVTDLLQVDQHRNCPNAENSDHSSRICSTCGLRIPDFRPSNQNTEQSTQDNSNLRPTESETNTSSTRSTIGVALKPIIRPSSPRSLPRPPNHRFFSHRYSAFNPTRVMPIRYGNRLSLQRSPRPASPSRRNWWRSFHAFNRSRSFASDELINYSERTNEEDTQEPVVPPPNFHPFDPPPEFATINPENIGIGNMYSNIVQELESSLNDVRNLRPGNRLGETSDMLSSFSERLESIMNQSNAILRNLRTSIETLTPERNNTNNPSTTNQNTNPNNSNASSQSSEPQVHFSDESFYLRDQNNDPPLNSSNLLDEAENIFANQRAAVADHTYPVNSRNSNRGIRYMSPLMASLHLTVSHIQRQARLLRLQVESIERIDRAMLEVAQLQMLRQMFTELQRHFRSRGENRHAVSSVRQMMAGARISDSSPYDSPEENSNSQNSSSEGPSRSSTNVGEQTSSSTQQRVPRKNFPRCIFLMHRNLRRGPVGNILHRRLYSRDRLLRRQLFRRGFNCRTLLQQSSVDLLRQNNGTPNTASMEILRTLIRRLEFFLMEHGQNIGIVVSPTRSPVVTHREEFALVFRLNDCRMRIISHIGFNHSINRQSTGVTADGASRFSARDILTTSVERLIRYIMFSSNQSYMRPLISDILDLSLLLSEILLLQIVDSIPPPSGMNLDTERESLSVRIDLMCSRMLSRINDNSQALSRSLRFTRLAVRQASNALNQTYRARRNAMLPSSFRDPRRTLLEEIHTCLRNIRRHETLPPGSTSNQLSTSDWFQTIQRLISRHRNEALGTDQPSTSGINLSINQSSNLSNNVSNNSGSESQNIQNNRPQVTSTSANNEVLSSDDDNNNSDQPQSPAETSSERTLGYFSPNTIFPRSRTTGNFFNILNDDDSSSTNNNGSPRTRYWNAPIIQVNDEPITQFPQYQSFQSYLTNRQRMSERFAELRTYPVAGLFRPRFLHPLYSGPIDNDLDESVREQLYDTSDMMTPVTPNHRIQVWDFSQNVIPNINDPLRNMVVNECKIHNDASVDIASDGSILVTLLPTGGYLNATTRLGVYSLEWETLGQRLYVADLEQNAVSVSLSPLNRHLVVGLSARRVSIVPSERWIMARIFALDDKRNTSNQLVSTREVAQIREPNSLKSVNCIRWLPVSGQGLVYGTNTGQLRILT